MEKLDKPKNAIDSIGRWVFRAIVLGFALLVGFIGFELIGFFGYSMTWQVFGGVLITLISIPIISLTLRIMSMFG